MRLNKLLEKGGYHFDTGKSGEEGSTAEKVFNQHHASSMYGAHMGYPADKDTIDFDDTNSPKPGVQAYQKKKDTINKGYEPIEDIDGIEKMKEAIDKIKEGVSLDDDNKNEMLSGIAQILSGVEDLGNRKELAKKQIIQLKDEGIEFDVREFLQMCGFNSNVAGIQTQSLTSEMSTNDIHFQTLLKIWSRGGNLKKQISKYLFPNKVNVSVNDIAKELRNMGYDDVKELEKHLRIDIHKY